MSRTGTGVPSFFGNSAVDFSIKSINKMLHMFCVCARSCTRTYEVRLHKETDSVDKDVRFFFFFWWIDAIC